MAASVETRQNTTSILGDNYPVSLAWKNVTFDVEVDSISKPKRKEWKTLLYNQSGIARAGRILAIMGPSGAGKTTLMSALAGRLVVDKQHVLGGTCELNGVPFTNNYKSILTVVAQDDIVMGKETPKDAFRFSARMRLGVGAAEAENAADEMLSVLRLDKCADTFIGIPGAIKGISGGEKKRVNIGCELISNPSIIIMDEPTTGLDTVNASRIGSLMKDLACNHGRTVVCTVHTPSSELFDVFDDLLLLAKGHVVYHGPREGAVAHFAALGHPVPEHTNPIEHYMDVLQSDMEELTRMWGMWEGQLVSDPRNDCIMGYPKPGEDEEKRLASRCQSRNVSAAVQFSLLFSRAIRMFRRDPASTMGRGLLTTYVAVLVGLFFFNVESDWRGVNNISGVIFLTAINQIMFSMLPGVMMFPAERAVFLNEQAAAMYHPSVYTVARILAETPVNFFFPSLFACVVYFMVGLRGDAGSFFVYFLILNLLSLVGLSLGMFASAVFPFLDMAMAFLPMCLMPLSIVAGLFANTDRLDPYWLWLTYISFPRYGYSALVVNEFKGRSLCPNGGRCLYQTGDDYLRFIGFDDWEWWMSAWILLLFVFFFWTCALLALTRQGLKRRGTLAFKAEAAPDPDVQLLEKQRQ